MIEKRNVGRQSPSFVSVPPLDPLTCHNPTDGIARLKKKIKRNGFILYTGFSSIAACITIAQGTVCIYCSPTWCAGPCRHWSPRHSPIVLWNAWLGIHKTKCLHHAVLSACSFIRKPRSFNWKHLVIGRIKVYPPTGLSQAFCRPCQGGRGATASPISPTPVPVSLSGKGVCSPGQSNSDLPAPFVLILSQFLSFPWVRWIPSLSAFCSLVWPTHPSQILQRFLLPSPVKCQGKVMDKVTMYEGNSGKERMLQQFKRWQCVCLPLPPFLFVALLHNIAPAFCLGVHSYFFRRCAAYAIAGSMHIPLPFSIEILRFIAIGSLKIPFFWHHRCYLH